MTSLFRVLSVVALAGALGCAQAPQDLSKTGGAMGVPSFATAAEYAAITVDGIVLSANAIIDVEFTQPGQVFGYLADLEAGQAVVIETFGTPGLDTVLFLFGPDDGSGWFGELPVAMDDDSGEDLFSRVGPYTVKKSGTYIAIVSTFEGAGKGHATVAMHTEEPNEGGSGRVIQPVGGCEPAWECGDPMEACDALWECAPPECGDDPGCIHDHCPGLFEECMGPEVQPVEPKACGEALDCALGCDPDMPPDECFAVCLEGADEHSHMVMGALAECAAQTDCGNDLGCLDELCHDLVVECLEWASEPMPVPPAACGAVLECAFGCDPEIGPEGCLDPCLEGADGEATEKVFQLFDCAANAGCGADPGCFEAACPEAFFECIEDEPADPGLPPDGPRWPPEDPDAGPGMTCAETMACTFELCDGPPEACVEPCLEGAPPEVHDLFWALLECNDMAGCELQGDCLAEHCGELTVECLGEPEPEVL